MTDARPSSVRSAPLIAVPMPLVMRQRVTASRELFARTRLAMSTRQGEDTQRQAARLELAT